MDGTGMDETARQGWLLAMDRDALESLGDAVRVALTVVRLAERKGIALEAEIYELEPGAWDFALRRPLDAGETLEDTLPEGAADEVVGGVAGACSAIIMRREPDADGQRESRDGGGVEAPPPEDQASALASEASSAFTGVTRAAGVPFFWTASEDRTLLRMKGAGAPVAEIAAALDTDRKHVLQRFEALTDGGERSPTDVLAALGG